MTEPDPAPDRHPADLVAERVLAVPAVAGLDGGTLGQVATYLPGRRVAGVSWRDDACEVAVVLRLSDRPLPELAEEVRRAVQPVAEGRAVHVVVADVVAPGDEPVVPYPQEPASGRAAGPTDRE